MVKTNKNGLVSIDTHKKWKRYDPLVWVLDMDTKKSAEMLDDYHLSKNIDHLVQIFVDIVYYVNGIRNKRMFNILFGQEKYRDGTILACFPFFDVPYFKFTFALYDHRVTKWTRKCKEHYEFFEDYLLDCLNEFEFRFKRQHGLFDIANYLLTNSALVKSYIPKGNIKEIQLEWKSISPRFRNKDILLSYQKFYAYKLGDPFVAYNKCIRDIPEFLLKNIENF